MQAPSEELITQFTEDTFAKENRVCQWSQCQALIHRGNTCYYVAAYDPTQPSKFVCEACYMWLQTQIPSVLPDPQHICQSISATHFKHQSLPPIHPQLPPDGPSIHIPSAWQKVPQPANPRPSGHVMMLPPGSTGYSAQYMHYRLEIWAVFGAGGKKKNLQANNISNICEGLKDINALSTACKLVAIVLETVVPHIKAYKWVNLSQDPNPQLYFYNDCLYISNQKGLKGMVFKPKQFMLFITMPANQWEEFEMFQEKLWSSTPTHTQQISQAELSAFTFDHPFSQDILHLQEGNNVDLDTVMLITTSVTSVKHHHHHTSSTSSGSTPLPPQKKHEALQSRGACEFDVKKVFQQKMIQVDFYPTSVHGFDNLLNKKATFNIMNMDVAIFSGNGQLDLSASALIGVGAFKTAQSVQLMLSPLRDLSIGSSLNHCIVFNRPFISNGLTEVGPPFIHYTLKDETNILYHEANALYWAKALLQMTYRFIDHGIKDTKAPPPFEIPCLQFVDAGLLFAYLNVSLMTAKGTGTVSATYLAEKFIPVSSDEEFMKYIHNGNAAPCILMDLEAEENVDFLAFTQHVQYIKTGGQVYISDYQGMFTCLMVHLACTYIRCSNY
ncbi:hypothetical protein V8B97DRAFT_2022499 [Scleroderma yunnanense]